MRNMILPLIAIAEQPQVVLGTGEVILDTAADPFVVWMCGTTWMFHLRRGDYSC